MGVKTLPEVVRSLTEGGRSAETPVAVIQQGTTPEQRTVTGTLADIVERVDEAGIQPPAITVVGEVVRLCETLAWFESKPLFGKRVLVTRTRRQASKLAKLLADEGAIPIELPVIEIERCADPAAVDAATTVLSAGDYTWAIFTSANAVEEWFGHLAARNLDARAFGGTKAAAIGPATAEALAAHGITADLIPPEYIAESVVQSMATVILSAAPAGNRDTSSSRRNPAEGTRGTTSDTGTRAPRVLLPRAADARPELPEGLRALGATVDEVTLYRAAVPSEAPAEALEMLRRGEIDIVTFTSSSTVLNLMDLLIDVEDDAGEPEADDIDEETVVDMVKVTGLEGVDELRADHIVFWREGEDMPAEFDAFLESNFREWESRRAKVIEELLTRPLIACIGPITAATARELGLRVDVEAPEHTVEGLVRAIRTAGSS
jgi:uroporphyrinogen III methyltransferase/synthase